MTTKLTLPYPPSANRYWRVNSRTGRPYRSTEATAFIDEVRWRLLEAGVTDPLEGPVAVGVLIFHSPGKRQDTDNTLKIAFDALQGFAYGNDSQIMLIEAEFIPLPRGVPPYLKVTIAPHEVRALLEQEAR